MEFRALIEKLDWKGDVIRIVRKYDDKQFKPDMTRFFREAIETGEIKTKELPVPKWSWDHSVSSVIKHVAPTKSQYYFSETEPGLRMVVGEYYPVLESQFVLMSKKHSQGDPKWIKTDGDLFAEVENGL